MITTRKTERAEWATPERENYLRWAWPADVPLTEVTRALSAMPGAAIPHGGVIGNFCTKTLLVKRTVMHLTWATEERKAYLRKAWPLDVPMAEIMTVLGTMEGRSLPLSARVQSYCSRILKVHRSNRQELATKSAAAKRAAVREGGCVALAPPDEVRGKPGVALPPISRSWAAIIEIGDVWGRQMLSKWDLISLNRSRIAMGYPPLAIKTAGKWRLPAYGQWS